MIQARDKGGAVGESAQRPANVRRTRGWRTPLAAPRWGAPRNAPPSVAPGPPSCRGLSPKPPPYGPGAYPGPSGARRSSRCCASSRCRRSWACWRRRLRGRRREGGGCARSCTAETALCAQRAPRVTETAPPTRRAPAPPPAPPLLPLPGGSPAPNPCAPTARSPSGSPGRRPGTRAPPAGGGGASATTPTPDHPS